MGFFIQTDLIFQVVERERGRERELPALQLQFAADGHIMIELSLSPLEETLILFVNKYLAIFTNNMIAISTLHTCYTDFSFIKEVFHLYFKMGLKTFLFREAFSS